MSRPTHPLRVRYVGRQPQSTPKSPRCHSTPTYGHDMKAPWSPQIRTPALIYISATPTTRPAPSPRVKTSCGQPTHLPKGAVLLVDEAYIHPSDEQSGSSTSSRPAKTSSSSARSQKACWWRESAAGFAMGRPDLLKQLQLFGANFMPVTAVAAAIASMEDPALVPARKKAIAAVRNQTFDLAARQPLQVSSPSVSNCFMSRYRTRRQGSDRRPGRSECLHRTQSSWPTLAYLRPHHRRPAP